MIPEILDFDNYRSYEGETAPTTYAQMQTYMSNQNKIIKAIVATHLWQPSTTYIVGQVVYSNSMTLNTCARCIVAGTSAENDEPTWGTVIGAHITDNGVTWEIMAASAATNATNATNDANGNNISSTYDTKTDVNNKILSALPVGTLIDFAFGTVPAGYLVCDGSAVSRTTYANLFTAIGTTYGTGDGSTTFTLPNLIDRVKQGSATVGTYKSAGLPNITGGINTVHNGNAFLGTVGGTGALSSPAYATNVGRFTQSDISQSTGIAFNAASSNSIYGSSTTVQPPALTVLPCIKY